jgi:SAM-dependent methyltransferase
MSSLEEPKPIQKWFASDSDFNRLFPSSMQILAIKHWTPIVVARKAAGFLTNNKPVRILDIGSGIGKFCLTAAYYYPNAQFIGVEQRADLVAYAEGAKEVLQLENASFIHGNFTDLDFREYDHFYFYNSFYENLLGKDKIDDRLSFSSELYNQYSRGLKSQLEEMPMGTRVAAFHSLEYEAPKGYRIVNSEFEDRLLYFIKQGSLPGVFRTERAEGTER